MKTLSKTLISMVLLLSLASVEAALVAETIYYGGPIISMKNDKYPDNYVGKAVAVAGGKIVWVGGQGQMKNYGDSKTVYVDLGGKTLLPGFIDGHSHYLSAGYTMAFAPLYSAPDGTVTKFDDLVTNLNAWVSQNQDFITANKWIVGFGYDDTSLAEQDHPTAAILDKVSTTVTVLAVHSSGHIGVVNSFGLNALGITPQIAASVQATGLGYFGVYANGSLNGVAYESAYYNYYQAPLLKALPATFGLKVWKYSQAIYLSNGFTTVIDGRTDPTSVSGLVQTLMSVPTYFALDLVIYPDYLLCRDNLLNATHPWQAYVSRTAYKNNVRIAGAKLALDGSIQARTAALNQPYITQYPGFALDFKGFSAYINDTILAAQMTQILSKKLQLLVHANGDAAIDQFFRTYTAVKATLPASSSAWIKYPNLDDTRTALIHAQMVNSSHFDQMNLLKVIPSFFGAHAFYWGDWHVTKTLGITRASKISPAKSAFRKSILSVQHTDAPVIAPNPLKVLWSTVNRLTRSSVVLGPAERLSIYEGLLSLTKYPAYKISEQATKGTIQVGKYADFVVLSANPLEVTDITLLSDLKVLKTIKRNTVLFPPAV